MSMKNWISNIDFVGLVLSLGCTIGLCMIFIVAIMLLGFTAMLCPYIFIIAGFIFIWYIIYKIVTEL